MRHEMRLIRFLALTFVAAGCSLSFISVANDTDCTSSDIERVDSCLMGRPLKEAISKLKVDTSQFFAFDEPPGILRGIYIRQSDTCIIHLYVERTSITNKLDSFPNWRMNYVHIIDKRVIGVTWKKPRQNKAKSVGFRIQYWHDLEH